MPSSFGSGLIEGVISGWQKQSEKQNALKQDKQKTDLENWLKVYKMGVETGDDNLALLGRDNATAAMQGKKPGSGKGQGQASPIWDRLGQLLKKALPQQPAGQGGLTENMPNGQAAPGTAGSTPGAGFPGSSQPAGAQPSPGSSQPAGAQPSPGSSQPAGAQPSPGSSQPAGAQPSPGSSQPAGAQPSPGSSQPAGAQPSPGSSQPAGAQPSPTATNPQTDRPAIAPGANQQVQQETPAIQIRQRQVDNLQRAFDAETNGITKNRKRVALEQAQQDLLKAQTGQADKQQDFADKIANIKNGLKAGDLTPDQAKEAIAEAYGVKTPLQGSDEKKVPGSALSGKTNPQTGQPYSDAFGNPIDPKQQYTFGKDKKFYPEGAGPDKMPTGELGQRIEANRIISDPNSSADDKTAAKATIKHLDQVEKGVEVRINAGNSSGQPVTLNKNEEKAAQDLAYGKLTMSMLSRLVAYSRTPVDRAAKMEAIYNRASELNPNFNAAQFEMGFRLAVNPRVQQQLASLDNVKSGVDDLLKASDAATRTGSALLNKAVIPGGIAIGGKRYSNFDTARTAFADELSGALGFGSATDMSREMGFNMTDKNLSPENFRAAIQDIVIPFVERKKQALLNQMGTYGQPGMNPAAGPGKGSSGPAPRTADQYLQSIGQQ